MTPERQKAARERRAIRNAKRSPQKQKKETSKKLLDWIFMLTLLFLLFCMYEMHTLQDLSPIDALSDILKDALKFGIPAYMLRAFLQDKVDIEMVRLKQINEMKKEYGDDFVYEEMDDDLPSMM